MASAIQWQTQLTIASADIGTTYADSTPAYLVTTSKARSLFIQNLTNGDLQLSFYGNLPTPPDNLAIASRSSTTVNITANSKPHGDDGAEQPAQTYIAYHWIGSAPGSPTGSLYIGYWNEIGG